MKSLRATGTRLGRIGAGPMSDALGKTGAMSHEVSPRSRNPRMAGPAFTVRIHTADILMVGKALSDCSKDHVLMIDGNGQCNTALWGGLTTQAALAKGVAGVVIDRAIRDSAEIARSRLPVFARANRSRCRRRGIRRRASGARTMRRRGGEPRRLAGWG